MKLENKVFELKDFASEMAKLKTEKHFDFLVTIVGEDFGEEGTGMYLHSRKHGISRTYQC
jgi:NADH-quinone oxidoreductase subunit C/D